MYVWKNVEFKRLRKWTGLGFTQSFFPLALYSSSDFLFRIMEHYRVDVETIADHALRYIDLTSVKSSGLYCQS